MNDLHDGVHCSLRDWDMGPLSILLTLARQRWAASDSFLYDDVVDYFVVNQGVHPRKTLSSSVLCFCGFRVFTE